MEDDVIIDMTMYGSKYHYVYVYRSSDPKLLRFNVAEDGSCSGLSITRDEAKEIAQRLLAWVDEA